MLNETSSTYNEFNLRCIALSENPAPKPAPHECSPTTRTEQLKMLSQIFRFFFSFLFFRMAPRVSVSRLSELQKETKQVGR